MLCQEGLVGPIRSFLRSHVPAYMSKLAVTVDIAKVKQMGIVPLDFVEKGNPPPKQQTMTERSSSQEEGQGEHNASTSSATNNNSDSTSAFSQMTTLPSCHCLCCPCTLFCEVNQKTSLHYYVLALVSATHK